MKINLRHIFPDQFSYFTFYHSTIQLAESLEESTECPDSYEDRMHFYRMLVTWVFYNKNCFNKVMEFIEQSGEKDYLEQAIQEQKRKFEDESNQSTIEHP